MITLINTIVGVIGIAVGIIGWKSLSASKIKNKAKATDSATIQQAQTINNGLSSVDVINLTEDIVDKKIREKTDLNDNKNHFIISSRPTDAFIGWNDFSEMSACALTKEQALNLIKKIDYSEPAKSTFYQELDNNLYDKYKSFASNPLLLTIMLLTFSNHASIPAKLNDFYEAAFSTLFNMHDATKDCYVRDTRTNLGIDEFKTIFS